MCAQVQRLLGALRSKRLSLESTHQLFFFPAVEYVGAFKEGWREISCVNNYVGFHIDTIYIYNTYTH